MTMNVVGTAVILFGLYALLVAMRREQRQDQPDPVIVRIAQIAAVAQACLVLVVWL